MMKNIRTICALILAIALMPCIVFASSSSSSSDSSSSSSSSSVISARDREYNLEWCRKQNLTQRLKEALSRFNPNFKRAAELVELGADVNIVLDEYGTTPLMFAAQKERTMQNVELDSSFGVYDFFCCAILAGADIEKRDTEKKTVKDYAAQYPYYLNVLHQVEVIHAMAQRAHNPGALKSYCQTVDWTEYDDDFNFNQSNELCKAPINYKLDSNGYTVCMLAANHNRTDDLALLLQASANVDRYSWFGFDNALSLAAQSKQNIASMQLLIDNGAKMDRALLLSVFDTLNLEKLNMAGVQLLMSHGIRYDQDDAVGCIGNAFRSGHSDCTKVMTYYLIAQKPTREKFKESRIQNKIKRPQDALRKEQEFQKAQSAWNARMQRAKNETSREIRGLVKGVIDGAENVAQTLPEQQRKECDAVLMQRAQVMGGGNMAQLLRQREQGYQSVGASALLKRRLTHRTNVSEMRVVNVGNVITKSPPTKNSKMCVIL